MVIERHQIFHGAIGCMDQKLTTAFRPRARALGVLGLPPGLIKTCAPGWREKPGRTWML